MGTQEGKTLGGLNVIKAGRPPGDRRVTILAPGGKILSHMVDGYRSVIVFAVAGEAVGFQAGKGPARVFGMTAGTADLLMSPG